MSSSRLPTLATRQLRASRNSYLQPLIQRASLRTTTVQNPVSFKNAATRTRFPSKSNAFSRPSPSRLILSSQPNSFTRSASSQADAAEVYVAYGMTQKLFEACSSQADYRVPQASQKDVPVPTTEAGEHLGVSDSWWYKELGLQPTFSTWSQITFLHMYLLTVRFRALPARESVQTYSRHLIDHFSHNAEHRMDVLHDIATRGIRNKYLKDLFIQWRGIIAAYDEGLVKGDAVLGAAVWRNLWKASPTGPDGKEIDWTKVAWVVAYMRRVVSELSKKDEVDLATDALQGSPIFGYSQSDKRLAGSQ